MRKLLKMAPQPDDTPHPENTTEWPRRTVVGATLGMGMSTLAGCMGLLEESMSQQSTKSDAERTQSDMPLSTEYGDTDHLYNLPDDPLTAPIPEPPEEPQSVADMNLYFAQMQFLQNVYLREMTYALRERGQNEDIPVPPWVSDNL